MSRLSAATKRSFSHGNEDMNEHFKRGKKNHPNSAWLQTWIHMFMQAPDSLCLVDGNTTGDDYSIIRIKSVGKLGSISVHLVCNANAYLQRKKVPSEEDVISVFVVYKGLTLIEQSIMLDCARCLVKFRPTSDTKAMFTSPANVRSDMELFFIDTETEPRVEELEIGDDTDTYRERRIFQVNHFNIKAKHLEVQELIEPAQLVNHILRARIHVTQHNPVPKTIIYYNQRGAGTGKTFESVQMLQSQEFRHKNCFVFLTKMHSARQVILSEFKEQCETLKLQLHDVRSIEGAKCTTIYFSRASESTQCTLIIATVDSFMFNCCKDTTTRFAGLNYFQGIVERVSQGSLKLDSGILRFAGQQIRVNKKLLVVIDEAQDLSLTYLTAFCEIMRRHYLDIFVIGDKLQSIMGQDNMFAEILASDLPETVKVEIRHGEHIVRRFHRPSLMSLVNKVVNYSDHGCVPIVGICPDSINCGFDHMEDANGGVEVFAVDGKKSISLQVINILSAEVNRKCSKRYLPQDFAIISPFISGDWTVEVENAVMEFWVSMFRNEEYRRYASSLDSTWDDYNINEYQDFVVVHKSVEGQPIDLSKSKKATRIMSVHAAKGTGRPVVILLNVNENNLCTFSQDTGNLVYESLLNVAITRQKLKLHVALTLNGDDIFQRFEHLLLPSAMDPDVQPCIDRVFRHIKTTEVIKWIDKSASCKTFSDAHFGKYPIPEMQRVNNGLVDMSDHILRHAILFYRALLTIAADMDEDEKRQIKTCFRVLSGLDLKKVSSEDFRQLIWKRQKGTNPTWIPILVYGIDNKLSAYNNYANQICDFIRNVQKKMKEAFKRTNIHIPNNLCPLESLVLVYMIPYVINGALNKIQDEILCTPKLLYQVWNEYKCNPADHLEYDCKCQETFLLTKSKQSGTQTKIVSHYELVKHIDSLYDRYKELLQKHCPNEKFAYNMLHTYYFAGKSTLRTEFLFKSHAVLLAYSEKSVIKIFLQPSISVVNFNEILACATLDTYYIHSTLPTQDEHNGNYLKFKDKTVHMAVWSLDPNDVFWYQLNVDDGMMERIIRGYLMDRYKRYATIVYFFYNHCKDSPTRKELKLNSYAYTVSKIKDPIPLFVKRIFYDANVKFEDDNQHDDLVANFDTSENFAKTYDQYLTKAVDTFFKKSRMVVD